MVADDEPTASVLSFRSGLPGFPNSTRFVLSDLTDDGTFQLLTDVDDPDVSLVVASPWLFFPDYGPDLPDAELGKLGIEGPDDVVVFCTVIADETDQLHLNLRAPFVASTRSLAAQQVLLDDPDLPLRAVVPAGG